MNRDFLELFMEKTGYTFLTAALTARQTAKALLKKELTLK